MKEKIKKNLDIAIILICAVLFIGIAVSSAQAVVLICAPCDTPGCAEKCQASLQKMREQQQSTTTTQGQTPTPQPSASPTPQSQNTANSGALQQQISSQENKITTLENQLNELQNQIAKLQNQLAQILQKQEVTKSPITIEVKEPIIQQQTQQPEIEKKEEIIKLIQKEQIQQNQEEQKEELVEASEVEKQIGNEAQKQAQESQEQKQKQEKKEGIPTFLASIFSAVKNFFYRLFSWF